MPTEPPFLQRYINVTAKQLNTTLFVLYKSNFFDLITILKKIYLSS
jgi:hypothetical protein